nr:hypothetical protein [bacterium]
MLKLLGVARPADEPNAVESSFIQLKKRDGATRIEDDYLKVISQRRQ